jgi:hypothetical protein
MQVSVRFGSLTYGEKEGFQRRRQEEKKSSTTATELGQYSSNRAKMAKARREEGGTEATGRKVRKVEMTRNYVFQVVGRSEKDWLGVKAAASKPVARKDVTERTDGS